MLALFETALPNGQILLILGLIFGLYMAWSIGANDVANAMGTAVGSGGLTLKKAVIIAGTMEFAGAVLMGSHVSDTVRGKMFDANLLEPRALVLGFMAALLASAAWLHIASSLGWPVSTTHTIVGAVVGIGVVIGGVKAVHWGKIGEIVASWGTSPVVGGLVSFLLFKLIQRFIIEDKHPLRQTYRFIPVIVFTMIFILSLVLVWKGLKNLGLNLTLGPAFLVAAATGIVAALLSLIWVAKLRTRHEKERVEQHIEIEPERVEEGVPFVRKEKRGAPEPEGELRPVLVPGSQLPARRWEFRREFEFEKVELVFATLLIVSAGFLAFAHGANDTANAIGPLAAIVSVVREGTVAAKATVPTWLLVLGGIGIVIGLATYGYKVMETVGKKITALTPSRGFAANLGAATTIVVASRLGFPVSTTHTLVGAVLGIGLARGIEHLNLRVIRDIVLSWVITVPAGALLAAGIYYVLRAIFI
jgi:phosphate/sulfate permease